MQRAVRVIRRGRSSTAGRIAMRVLVPSVRTSGAIVMGRMRGLVRGIGVQGGIRDGINLLGTFGKVSKRGN